MSTANINTPAPIPATSSVPIASRLLRPAFITQSILLVLLICMMGFVSWRYSVRQAKWAEENLNKQNQLDELDKSLHRAMNSLANSEFNFAIYLMQAKKYDDALLQVDNSLRDDPGRPLPWRIKAMILIRANRAKEGLGDFQNAKLDSTDGRNLLTEAILNCAVKQTAKADELKARALANYTPQWNDKDDYKSACGRPLR